MLTEETIIGDPTPLDPCWHLKKRYNTRFSSMYQPTNDFPYFVKIFRGIARYDYEICLDNINLEVSVKNVIVIVISTYKFVSIYSVPYSATN